MAIKFTLDEVLAILEANHIDQTDAAGSVHDAINTSNDKVKNFTDLAEGLEEEAKEMRQQAASEKTFADKLVSAIKKLE